MSNRSRTTEAATAVRVAIDILCLNAAFCASYWIRFHSPFTALVPVLKGVPPFRSYLAAFPVATLAFVYLYKLLGSYARRWRYDAANEFFVVTRGTTAGMIALMALTFLLPSTHSEAGLKYSRITFLLLFPLVESFVWAGRLASNAVEKRLYRRSAGTRKLLLVGTGETAARLARHVRRNPTLECEIVGFVRCPGEKSSSSRIVAPIAGELDALPALLERGGVDELILTNPKLDHARVLSIVALCEKNLVEFKHVPDMFEILTRKVEVVSFDGVPLVGIRHIPLHSPWNRFLKRSFDVAGSALGLVVAAPVIALCALAVKLDSRGKAFFSQERCGEDGVCFRLHKLRTMVEDAERHTGPVWARAEDPRCTRVGAFLRRRNLDELPQLWNVLKGEMSLVGPRPERPHFVNRFREENPRYMARHSVKSGITGWAQVNGLRGNTSVRARLRYDMYYLENWSLLFDLKVLILTLFARRNAY
ncbi:MAG: undecaprenyl-phosphate glucose phosphotransferase [Candidatus Aureabacteria bacterium]|nr:undecaprenyl-phosphate glucose phosphotransferase [Candidatus Auribacterota bacterium]